MPINKELKRYTNLPSLLLILQKRVITLLPPVSWDDQNDRQLMKAYASATKSKTCLALCFAQAVETYHHWRVFSPGSDGVCIIFNKEKLIAEVEKNDVRHGPLKYFTLRQIEENQPRLIDLPFSKRQAYKDEREYRFLFESPSKTYTSKNIPITPVMIERILINPWVAEQLFFAVKETINSIDGFEDVVVRQSSVRSARNWQELAGKYAATVE